MMDLPGLGIKDAVVVPGKGIKSSAFLRVTPESKIIAQDFMERIQIDLIDMRHSPDGDFNYIGHLKII